MERKENSKQSVKMMLDMSTGEECVFCRVCFRKAVLSLLPQGR